MPFNKQPAANQRRARGSSCRPIAGAVSIGLLLLSLVMVTFVPATSSTPNDITLRTSALEMEAFPIADAGGNISTILNKTVTFDGSFSLPSDGASISSYVWTFEYYEVIYTLEGPTPTFKFNKTTVSGLAVEVTLNVTDSNGLYDTDTVWVFVRNAPPTFMEKYWLDIAVLAAIAAILGYFVGKALMRLVRGEEVVTESGREKFGLSVTKTKKIMIQLLKNPMGLIGVIMLSFFIFMGAFGPIVAPYRVDIIDLPNAMKTPTPDHWLGTDNFGRDIFSELLFGAQTSIVVGIVSAIIASLLGAAVGLYSGYVGGWKDEVVMRANDVVLSIPWLVLMIIVAAFIGKIDLTGIILIIGLTGWSTTARMVRAQVLSVKERQYVERARSIGASEMSIIRRHIFPNTFPLIFANTILTVAVSILSEATLSFLGLRPAGVVTWGTMLAYANDYDAFSNGLEWWTLAPGLSIVGVVLGFTLLGYALDEILNPKLRHR